MDFTPWTLFTDLGFLAALILFCQIIRAKVTLIQKLFLPASLMAGLLGLAFGPNGLKLIPFSSSISTYPGILIALVFAGLPFTSKTSGVKALGSRVGSLWAFSQFGMLMQYGLGAAFGMYVLSLVWPDLNPAFGLMLAAGFVGGHGTAAAIGTAFNDLGWPDATSLAMTSATVGIVAAIVGGLILINLGARKRHTTYISHFDDLPEELRTGLIPEDRRTNIARETISPMALEPLTMHFALMALAAAGGYYLSKATGMLMDKVQLPVFCCAFIVGFLISKIAAIIKADSYIEPRIISRFGSMFTDVLVAFGVASIKLPVVMQYAVPLLLLFICGVGTAVFLFGYLGPRFLSDHWFEKAIFTWGWMTGTVATGIALLRIVDPKLQSKTLDDFALAYLPVAPVEIALVSFSPALFMSGNGGLFVLLTVGAGIAIWLFAIFKGWYHQTPMTEDDDPQTDSSASPEETT